jgi:CBS domain-containing protein/gamma-glutamylcysteine synthetase
MGEHDLYTSTQEERLEFAARLLNDLRAIELMQERGLFESETRRIGAEQEFCLVDSNFRPSIRGPEILAAIDEPHFTTELARYTLEINLDPIELKDRPFSQLHGQLDELLDRAERAAARFGDKVVLAGILPSIGMTELDSRFMTPAPRYEMLQERIRRMRGGDFELSIYGVDDVIMRHDNIMFEACNTSFQVHLQIAPEELVDQYNWALAISGPMLAIATNSPMLFGRELWAETRIALFQQSIDTRTRDMGLRQRQARVHFGNRWIRHSLIEIFQEDIARYPLMTAHPTEDSLEQLEQGKVPTLRSLALHNGTIWKWNRVCFGSNGQCAHLRLENRYLPAGPTKLDEIANAAFWIGLMCAMPQRYRQIWKTMDFLEAKDNFLKAALHGLDVELSWLGKIKNVRQLILEDLLPLAQQGLESQAIDASEIGRYLSVIEHRTVKRMTGSHWLKQSFRSASPDMELLQKKTALTQALWQNQQSGIPVADWPIGRLEALPQESMLDERVDLLMTTDLITVLADDHLAFVQQIMRWRHIRHVPVENEDGQLVGLVTASDLSQFCSDHDCQEVTEVRREDGGQLRVADIMVARPICISPHCRLSEARQIMSEHDIDCLPVAQAGKLMGLLTTHDIERLYSKSLTNSR